MPEDTGRPFSSETSSHLHVVEDPTVATKIVDDLKENHDLELELGAPSGPLGTWVEMYVGDTKVVIMDYFSGPGIVNEGTVWYALPSLIEKHQESDA